MRRPAKALVTKERTVHTYSELWHASSCVLEAGRRDPKGSSWQFLSSAMLTAFAFEAYLNHAGSRAISCWESLERLPPISKLDLLREVMKVDSLGGKNKRPLQTVHELFEFRSAIAHGKTEAVRQEPRRRDVNVHLDDYLGQRPTTRWERLIKTDAFAQRAREDSEAVLKVLHAARPEPKEALFTFGIGVHSAIAQQDP